MYKFDIDIPPDLTSDLKSEVSEWSEKVLNSIAEVLPGRVETVFDSEGIRDGVGAKWAPTSHIARSKRKSGIYDAKTLTDTGNLRNSIKSEVKPFPSGSIVVLGSDLSYAGILQSGGKVNIEGKTYKLPPRPFIFLTSEDEKVIDKIIKDTEL